CVSPKVSVRSADLIGTVTAVGRSWRAGAQSQEAFTSTCLSALATDRAMEAWYHSPLHEIPIVMAETGDPIGTGLVASLPRPGGNVTGIASVTAELAGKSVQLIRDMLPSARWVTALANATDPFSKPFLEQIQLGGEATGTAINPIRINNNEEFESAFAAMERDRPDAIIVQ